MRTIKQFQTWLKEKGRLNGTSILIEDLRQAIEEAVGKKLLSVATAARLYEHYKVRPRAVEILQEQIASLAPTRGHIEEFVQKGKRRVGLYLDISDDPIEQVHAYHDRLAHIFRAAKIPATLRDRREIVLRVSAREAVRMLKTAEQAIESAKGAQ